MKEIALMFESVTRGDHEMPSGELCRLKAAGSEPLVPLRYVKLIVP
jgi:hypothetical protein